MTKFTNPLWIETDNALGSRRGDVDDGFALALSQVLNPDLYITSYGNCPQIESFENTKRLFSDFSKQFNIIEGATGKQAPSPLPNPTRDTVYLGLGPLTSIAEKIGESQPKFQRLVLLGGRPQSKGFLYPHWPHEFNFALDGLATRKVFTSNESIELIPLNQATRLRLPYELWKALPNSPFPFKDLSHRWIKRNQLIKGKKMIILWDVVATATLIWPDLFQWDKKNVVCNKAGRIAFSRDGKSIRVLKDFNVSEVLSKFLETIRTVSSAALE